MIGASDSGRSGWPPQRCRRAFRGFADPTGPSTRREPLPHPDCCVAGNFNRSGESTKAASTGRKFKATSWP